MHNLTERWFFRPHPDRTSSYNPASVFGSARRKSSWVPLWSDWQPCTNTSMEYWW